MRQTVRVVGIGGSRRPGSRAERALRLVLDEAERLGAETRLVPGEELVLPLLDPRADVRPAAAERLLAEVAAADGIVLASPVYHGAVSGLLKNALDHLEGLRDDERPYLSGRAVGSLAVGEGWQGAMTTLSALRDTVHALRGWNTPLGVAVNTTVTDITPDGGCTDPHVQAQLTAMARQVVEFATARRALGQELRPAEPVLQAG
ncbi:NADPH-dependent FMN reductase [Streptomyces sp. NPDC101160]|uniref:NADPH-dependent FMN reductase n=1 Tax=Streptomyces sp. NPDC101160 TaxID=3366118 RepID=UPI003825E181